MTDRNALREAILTRPSPLCPLAVPLVISIRKAVAEVEGVTRQEIEVVGYVGAEDLTAMLQELAEAEQG